MQRTRPLLLSIVALGLLACSNSTAPSDENEEENGHPFGTFTATVNGAAYSGAGTGAASLAGNVLGFGGSFVASNITRTITFVVNGVDGPGTYSVADPAAGTAVYAEVDGTGSRQWTSIVEGGSGSVVVTQMSGGRLKGTFTFTGAAVTATGATGTRTVTSGTFDIPTVQ